MRLGCEYVDKHDLMDLQLTEKVRTSSFLALRENVIHSSDLEEPEFELRSECINTLKSESNKNMTVYSAIRAFLDEYLPCVGRFKKTERWAKDIICDELTHIFQQWEVMQNMQ